MKKSLKIKRIISLAAASILAFGFIMASFADDTLSPEPVTDPVQDSIIFSDSELEFIEAASDDNDRAIRIMAVDSSRSTGHDINDIYDILYSVLILVNNQYMLRVYDPTFYSMQSNWNTQLNYALSQIQTVLQSNNYYYDGANTYSQVQLLYNISASLGQIYSELYSPVAGNQSIYWNVKDMLDTLIAGLIDANDNPYLGVIENHLSTISSYSYQILNSSINCVGYLQSIYSYIPDIKNNTDTLVSTSNNIKNNTDTIISSLSSSGDIASAINTFRTNYSNIQYDFLSNGQFVDNNGNIVSSNVTLTNTSYSNYYFKFTYSNSNPKSIYKIILPCYPNASYRSDNYKIHFYNVYNNTFTELKSSYVYSYFNSNRCLYIYLYNAYLDHNNLYIQIEPLDNDSFILTNVSYTNYFSLSFIPPDNKDFLDVYSFLFEYNTINTLTNFKELYASDDLLAAKENQQSYENSGIQNFTGSGSAAASVSDVVDLKDVSTTLKNGLPNSGSVNNVLNIFNGNSTIFSDIWGWFSQSNYDDINNPSLRTRDNIIDFISDNERCYNMYMQTEEGNER